MPVSTTKIEGLPAVLSTFTGLITEEDTRGMFDDVVRLLADAGNRYYHIVDVREADTNIAAFAPSVAVALQNDKFHHGDPNMHLASIGNSRWIFSIRNMLRHQGIDMPSFPNLEAAIAYVRDDFNAFNAAQSE